ncbi:unnamed protein product [Dicrocoelium dendriticum]|nr:unnamed protein product [Dicrocoelium dendriticum]
MTDNASSVGGALVESEGEDLNESSNMIQYDRYGFYGGKEYTNPENFSGARSLTMNQSEYVILLSYFIHTSLAYGIKALVDSLEFCIWMLGLNVMFCACAFVSVNILLD